MKLNYFLVGSIAAMKTPTLITATDVIDVLQDECHQAVYEGVPKQSMIKGWRKKFLEKSKNIKKFIELQSCAIYELDSLNPKLTEDPSDDALIQMHDDFEAKSFASVGSLFDFVLDNIFGQSNARKFTSSSYDPIDVIEEAHSIKEMTSFKQQMQTCDLLFRKVITTHTNDCKSQKAQAKKFTRLFLRANIKRSKYEQQFDLDLSTGKPTGKPGTKPTGKPQVTAG